MKKTNKNYLIVFSICFFVAWLSAIFYFDKNDFDIEFREKGMTIATIFNFGTHEVVQELYDGRETNAHEVKYIEYYYVVDGLKYQYGSEHFEEGYSIDDEIEIEYVKSNPVSSRVKGLEEYKYNFFIRNLMMVCIFSFFGMVGVFYAYDRLNNRDTGWQQ